MTSVNLTTKLVQNKLGLLNLAAELNNISKACKIMGVSRDTFYRYQEANEKGGLEGLLEKSRNRTTCRTWCMHVRQADPH